jgi:hypothetical protein
MRIYAEEVDVLVFNRFEALAGDATERSRA